MPRNIQPGQSVPSAEAGQPAESFGRRWLASWVTGVLVSLLFVALLWPFQNLPVVRMLDRWGGDAAMQIYMAQGVASPHPVVLVDLDAPVQLATLTPLLAQVLQAGPAAVALDLSIQDAPESSPEGAALDQRLDAFVAVMVRYGAASRIVLPVANHHLGERLQQARLAGTSTITIATADLLTDEDGVVRSTQRAVCVDQPPLRPMLPTLAAAMFADLPSSDGCGDPGLERRILFAPLGPPGDGDADPSSILLLPGEAVGAAQAALRGAYIILGHLGPGREDSFMTPIGPMPGAAIHAQAVRTWAGEPAGRTWRQAVLQRHPVLVQTLLGLGISAFTGVFSALYAARVGAGPDVTSGKAALSDLGYGLFGLAGAGLMLLLGGWLYTVLAAHLILEGLFIGTLMPVFGSMLEALADMGRHLVAPMEWLAGQLIATVGRVLPGARLRGRGRGGLALLLGLLGLPALARADAAAQANAAGCVEQIRSVTGVLADVTVAGYPALGQVPFILEPFSHVAVDHARTQATLDLPGATGTRQQIVAGQDPPNVGSLIVPPCPPVRLSSFGAWMAFWSELNRPATQQARQGTTAVLRGQAAVSGPLRPLGTLLRATGIVPQTSGLALAWAGGVPPYSVAVTDAATGAPLGWTQTGRSRLWWPEWRNPASPFVATVHDAQGSELRLLLHPLAATAVADTELGDAILLFQTAPPYRLEALRRIAMRAGAGDFVARRALDTIQQAGQQVGAELPHD